MSGPGLFWCLFCAALVASISLTSSHLYRRETQLTSEVMAFASFTPGFIFSLGALTQGKHAIGIPFLVALLVKNLLYGFSFFFRYESLRRFGPFKGALMLGAQPIAIFLLGTLLLHEDLSSGQAYSVFLTAAAVLLVAKRDDQNEVMGPMDFLKYFLFPALASTLVTLWDRHYLKGAIPSSEFFLYDRLMLLPCSVLVLFFIKPRQVSSFWSTDYSSVLNRQFWGLLIVGLLFTVSAYSFNLALKFEKAALVSLFRNSAYPCAALVGAFMFQQKVSLRQWLSLACVFIAVILAAY